MKISSVFNFVSEDHKFTEKYFYEHAGMYPVYSATLDAPVGYVDEYNMEEPCILVVNYGKAGSTRYINDKKYNIGRNVCGLILKEEYKDKIILEYARYILEKEFCVAVEEGNMGCLSQSSLKEFDFPFPLPSKKEQNEYIGLMNKLLCSNQKVKEILDYIDEMLESVIQIPNDDLIQGDSVPIAEIFDCIGGNSGLTESFIYNHQNDEGLKCRVLSGATIENNELEMISEDVILNGHRLKFCNGEGILVFRKGDAGTVRFLPQGNYTINDDAYILTVKASCKYNINLKWFSMCYGKIFKEYASGSGNGTWNKTEFFNHVYVKIPSMLFQQKVANYYEYLEKIKQQCEEINLEIKKIRSDV